MEPARLFIAAICCSLTWGQDWQLWSPRDEIAPRATKDPNGELVLDGGGNPAVFGGWQRVYPGIRAGQWYKLQLRYRATGLEFEPLQLPVRLEWQQAGGKRAGQPDYAWRVTTDGDWRTLTHEAPAPESASAVSVQLWLQNAPRGNVRWKDISLTPTQPPPPRKVRLATIRLHPKGDNPVARFAEIVEAKVAQGTDVILLPEGVTIVGTGKKYADVAEPVPGPTTRALGELARRKQAWIVAGVYERAGKVIYNTAVLIGRDGSYAGKYRKVYIPREELEGGITPGSDYPTFKTDFGTVGMMICWDVQYADPARGLALRGAELILMPIWGGSEALAKARAIENHLFVASSGYDFPSLIFDPDGETLARTEQDGTVATATIDLSRRYVDPWLGDMRARYFRELRSDVSAEPAARK
jgi:predicted amidohydrolase